MAIDWLAARVAVMEMQSCDFGNPPIQDVLMTNDGVELSVEDCSLPLGD